MTPLLISIIVILGIILLSVIVFIWYQLNSTESRLRKIIRDEFSIIKNTVEDLYEEKMFEIEDEFSKEE